MIIKDQDYYSMTEDERALYRRYHYGIIYQQPLWISSLTVRENVAFILHLADVEESTMDPKAMEMLTLVGMDKWADYRPSELSSGQQQKISLARSLTLNPLLIVADEPTGNLDTVSGQELIDTFRKLNGEGKTIVMVTHDLEYLRYGTHLIHMIDGHVVEEVMHDGIQKFVNIKGKRGNSDPNNSSGGESTNVRDEHFLEKNKL